MMNLYLYEMAKVREQEFLAEAARQRGQHGHNALVANVAKLLRRGHRGQH